jgi:hypothetical protein
MGKAYISRKEQGMAKDYIPRKEPDFDNWLAFLIQYVDEKCGGNRPEWTHIPPEARSAVSDAYAAWEAAYAKTKGRRPHTQVDTEAKNDAEAAAKAIVRPFVNQYLRYPPVTNEDRTAMGIPNKDTHPSPLKPPETGPSFSIIQMGQGALGIVYRNGAKGKRGSKPKGVTSVKICMGVSDEPIIDQEMLPGAKKATKCPFLNRFREADRGKRAYFACKWELSKQDGESPWSEIQSEIIP